MNSRTSSKRIGLYGGSFDPPHIGHVALVEKALEVLPLDELRIVPVGIPVHRELSAHVAAEQRLHWIEALFAGDSRVKVWDWEVRRQEPTATIDTLRQVLIDEPNAHILLVLGGDAFAEMESWQGYPGHRQLCNVAVFTRQGVPRPRLAGWYEASLADWQDTDAYGQVIYVDAELPDISATGLRAALEAGAGIPSGLPAAIAEAVMAAYRND